MSVERQHEAFDGEAAFQDMILGLIASGERLFEALQLQGEREPVPNGAVIDMALGLVSLRRTLRAQLSLLDTALAAAPPVPSAAAPRDPLR